MFFDDVFSGDIDTTSAEGDETCPPLDVSSLDIRVGQITLTQHHPLSSKLYVNHVHFDNDLERPSVSFC